MDLQLFFRVVARFKSIIVVGLIVALALAFLSLAQLRWTNGRPQFYYRSHEIWESNSRVLVTGRGFKWGSTNPGAVASDTEVRLPTLTALYASFVTSDPVRRIMLRSGRIQGAVTATPLAADANGNGTLPVVSITATGFSLRGAVLLGQRAADALRTYVEQQQIATGIPSDQRIEVRPMNVAYAPQLLQPRSKTMPIVVFLAVMFATLSLAFLLENLRPRVRAVADPPLAPFNRAEEAPVARDRSQYSA